MRQLAACSVLQGLKERLGAEVLQRALPADAVPSSLKVTGLSGAADPDECQRALVFDMDIGDEDGVQR